MGAVHAMRPGVMIGPALATTCPPIPSVGGMGGETLAQLARFITRCFRIELTRMFLKRPRTFA